MRPEFIALAKFEEGNPDNKERDKFNRQNETLLYHHDKVGIVFIGDSITAYWDLDSYFTHPARIINRGISNDRSMYLKKRFEADALQLQPGLIVLSVGVNNTKDLDEDLTKATSERIIHEITRDIEEMIVTAQSRQIDIAVTSVTSTFRTHLKSFELRAETVKYANQELKALTQRYHIPYIDYYTPMTEMKENIDHLSAELSDDGLHPHVLGYDIMAQVIADTLKDYNIQLKHTAGLNKE